MKAILEFNLPEDREDFETANNASKYISTLSDIKNMIRGFVKYGIFIDGKECASDVEVNLTHFICDKIFELIPNDYNV
jgi:hypothetical protein